MTATPTGLGFRSKSRRALSHLSEDSPKPIFFARHHLDHGALTALVALLESDHHSPVDRSDLLIVCGEGEGEGGGDEEGGDNKLLKNKRKKAARFANATPESSCTISTTTSVR